MSTVAPGYWIAFNVSIIALMIFDAFVLHAKDRPMTLKRALGISAFWLILTLAFNVLIYFWMGGHRAMEFLSAFMVEQSLSVDNLFVFLLIFQHFKVNDKDQEKILLWGIISAQVMRAAFILGGVALLNHFHWMIFIFGGILVVTGIKLFFKKQGEEEVHPEDNPVFKWIGQYVNKFFFVLIIIEVTDLIFAIDSIPAVLSITRDPFIAYTSNIFAILGLRAMYFALASFMKVLKFLHYGLGVILVFIGLKMLVEGHIHVPVLFTLGFIILTLTVTVVASIACAPKPSKQ